MKFLSSFSIITLKFSWKQRTRRWKDIENFGAWKDNNAASLLMETIPFIRSLESWSLNYTFTIIQVESLNTTNDIMIQHEQGSASCQSVSDISFKQFPLTFLCFDEFSSFSWRIQETQQLKFSIDLLIFAVTSLTQLFNLEIHVLHLYPPPSFVDIPSPPFMLIVGSWLIYLYIIPCIRMRICAACAWRIQIFVGDLLYREWIQHNELQAMYAVHWLWSFMLSINEMIQFIIGWKFRFPSWLLSFGSDFWDVTYSRLYILVNQCLSLPYFFLISCV